VKCRNSSTDVRVEDDYNPYNDKNSQELVAAIMRARNNIQNIPNDAIKKHTADFHLPEQKVMAEVGGHLRAFDESGGIMPQPFLKRDKACYKRILHAKGGKRS
jgi:hypothetical protein